VGHHTEVAPDRDGEPRKAVVFELSLCTDSTGETPEDLRKSAKREKSSLWTRPLAKLRELAVTEPPTGAPQRKQRSSVRERSEAVRVYVLRRANGTCEGCCQPAPFESTSGKPYLEPHHTRRLADGGPDHPRWVGALCPNCHARVHYGRDGREFNEQLILRLGELECGGNHCHREQ
jgi:5-methylcytosine-specific restriction protein A